jgi:hypothetical protein
MIPYVSPSFLLFLLASSFALLATPLSIIDWFHVTADGTANDELVTAAVAVFDQGSNAIGRQSLAWRILHVNVNDLFIMDVELHGLKIDRVTLYPSPRDWGVKARGQLTAHAQCFCDLWFEPRDVAFSSLLRNHSIAKLTTSCILCPYYDSLQASKWNDSREYKSTENKFRVPDLTMHAVMMHTLTCAMDWHSQPNKILPPLHMKHHDVKIIYDPSSDSNANDDVRKKLTQLFFDDKFSTKRKISSTPQALKHLTKYKWLVHFGQQV